MLLVVAITIYSRIFKKKILFTRIGHHIQYNRGVPVQPTCRDGLIHREQLSSKGQ